MCRGEKGNSKVFKKCSEGNIGEAVEQGVMLCDEVEPIGELVIG